MMLRLGERLRDVFRFELIKLPAAQRPEGTARNIRDERNVHWLPQNWTPPSSWLSYDEDIPEWYEAQEEKRRRRNL